jgi:hypothetical protein
MDEDNLLHQICNNINIMVWEECPISIMEVEWEWVDKGGTEWVDIPPMVVEGMEDGIIMLATMIWVVIITEIKV